MTGNTSLIFFIGGVLRQILLLFSLLFLASCGQETKIQKLKENILALENQLTSLQKEYIERTENGLKNLSIAQDSVQAGEGLFQVLNRMGINDEQRRKIVLAIQDSVELSVLRVGQTFIAAKDSAQTVHVFRYQADRKSVV